MRVSTAASRGLLLVYLGKKMASSRSVSSFQPAVRRTFVQKVYAPSSSVVFNNPHRNFPFKTAPIETCTRRSMTTSVSLPEYGKPSYGITKKVTGKDFDTVVEDVSSELKKYGFGVLTKIDMKETMQKKIDVDFTRPYVILGACNPKLASLALQSQPPIGLFLPCNIAVSQDPDDSIVVSVISPKVMFSVVDSEDSDAVAELADDVQETMTKVIDAL
mmetsp:Transcript_58099/g.142017  ORF Transcript_58099/g.142017 Transcript_58099/m.142017 type:complete len:217 (-) Transcript_58099:114-764(-)